jgi:hypothetical protein
LGRMAVLGSKYSGIERSPRRCLRYRPAGGTLQASAPKFPRPLVDPTRLGPEHHICQAIRAKHRFETPQVLERSEAHRLRQNPELGARLRAYVLPPEKLPLQLGQKISRKRLCVRCVHAFKYSIAAPVRPLPPARIKLNGDRQSVWCALPVPRLQAGEGTTWRWPSQSRRSRTNRARSPRNSNDSV